VTLATRVNTLLLLLLVLMAGAIIAILATRAYGGPLDPPAAPGSTDSVRLPGTPISSIPFTASQPGHYYLTRNLTASGAGQTGITVAADDVSIDLGGFVLAGNGTTAANGTGTGIGINPGKGGTRIPNGEIKFWGTGIGAYGSGYTAISDVQARNNSINGIVLSAHGSIERCNASGNGLNNATNGSGIHAGYATVKDCVVTDNAVYGIWVEGNADVTGNFVRNNNVNESYYGIYVTGHGSRVADNLVCQQILVGDQGVTPTDSNVIWHNVSKGITDYGTHTFAPVRSTADLPGNIYPDGSNMAMPDVGC
jgi:hypothetical protein